MEHTKLEKSQRPRVAATSAISILLAALTGSITAVHAQDTKRVIVASSDGSYSSAIAAVHAAGGQVKLQITGTNAVAANVPTSALDALSSAAGVAYVEDDVLRYLPEEEMAADAITTNLSMAAKPSGGKNYFSGQTVPYGIRMVQADQLPNGDSKARNRRICIIDSGYDLNHEDLDNSRNVTGEFDTGTGWWYTDENSHGTHVAGTVAALNNSGIGVVGVLPNRKINLHIVKVFGATAWQYSSTLVDAAYKCEAAGSNVISMSLSGPLPSTTEEEAFNDLLKKGILSVAAASNAGTPALRYPASYDSVVSVGALDVNKQWASFSNFNHQVELSAPGVDVLSTVPMGRGSESELSVGGTMYQPGSMADSPKLSVTAPLADFGLGLTTDPTVAGKVCLISRGVTTFAAKVVNCQDSGGVGAVVYNNASGSFNGSLGGTQTNIPSVTASDTEGAAMKNQLGQSATVTVKATNYALFNGTSMATPHVSAVAALVWSYFPDCTVHQIRSTLAKSAEDLGDPGRDFKYGFGLVRAKAAYDRLATFGCNN